MHTKEEITVAFGRLYDVMLNLRQKCPWDRKQTDESLRPNTIEEVYELSDALMKGNQDDICEEIGDVLEHVIFYSIFGKEKESFDMADVCNKEADKLISRHPHIYGNQKADTADDVIKTWEQVKVKETVNGEQRRVLSGVPTSLPSVIKAYRIQEKARGVGFDWAKKEDVWQKVHEELDELEVELKKEDNGEGVLNEFGDYLFSLINAARLYNINPDNALEHTNNKFKNRFNYIEQRAIDEGKSISDMSLDEMDKLWNEAKGKELKS
jgi:XTP/dITP diphosphohydrolase